MRFHPQGGKGSRPQPWRWSLSKTKEGVKGAASLELGDGSPVAPPPLRSRLQTGEQSRQFPWICTVSVFSLDSHMPPQLCRTVRWKSISALTCLVLSIPSNSHVSSKVNRVKDNKVEFLFRNKNGMVHVMGYVPHTCLERINVG